MLERRLVKAIISRTIPRRGSSKWALGLSGALEKCKDAVAGSKALHLGLFYALGSSLYLTENILGVRYVSIRYTLALRRVGVTEWTNISGDLTRGQHLGSEWIRAAVVYSE